MSAAALVFGIALLAVFTIAMVLDFYESRAEWREWQADHPEPPSNLDRLDAFDSWADEDERRQ